MIKKLEHLIYDILVEMLGVVERNRNSFVAQFELGIDKTDGIKIPCTSLGDSTLFYNTKNGLTVQCYDVLFDKKNITNGYRADLLLLVNAKLEKLKLSLCQYCGENVGECITKVTLGKNDIGDYKSEIHEIICEECNLNLNK